MNFFNYVDGVDEPGIETVQRFISEGGQFDPKALNEEGETQLIVLTRLMGYDTCAALRTYVEHGGAPNTKWLARDGITTEFQALARGTDLLKLPSLQALYYAPPAVSRDTPLFCSME